MASRKRTARPRSRGGEESEGSDDDLVASKRGRAAARASDESASTVALGVTGLAVSADTPGLRPPPTRSSDGELVFEDHPRFRPRLTPKEVLQAGAFGGGYFRPIVSSVVKARFVRPPPPTAPPR